MAYLEPDEKQVVAGDLIVIDNSVMMRWLFNDGSAADGRYAQAVLGELKETSCRAIVPTIWGYEAGFVIEFYRKRGAVTDDEAVTHLAALFDLVTVVVDKTEPQLWLEWSMVYGVSTYDAGYLELAKHTNSPLATLDKKMRNVADKCRIKTFMNRV